MVSLTHNIQALRSITNSVKSQDLCEQWIVEELQDIVHDLTRKLFEHAQHQETKLVEHARKQARKAINEVIESRRTEEQSARNCRANERICCNGSAFIH